VVDQLTLQKTLKKHFGYDSFRAQQQQIIETVLTGKDCLAIMPTGGGKSICFQLPALLLPGVTIVISPLIALMKDQVDGLTAHGIPAAYYNSSQEGQEQNEIINKVANGILKLLYIAPESLPNIQNLLSERYVSCVAVDEAHCISSWGHDFRPSYQQLSFFKKQLPNTPIIALTATADKATRQDIANQLMISEAPQFISSFDRKNISLEVRPADKRVDQILSYIKSKPGESGIIYCLSRKSTEQVAKKLKEKGLRAEAYHAGLNIDKRSKIQDDFIHDHNQIVCATVAFGMGIDKSNVRWVIHHNMPKNLEGYYQEIGRAGRDGLPSSALLFNTFADMIQLRRFIQGTANEEMQSAKLDRMKQFADATSCRRKVLLSYFGELLATNCGNCDVCKNPPEFFDGTLIAQKALSAIYRLKEKEGAGTIIDVLRGARNSTVLSKGYNGLKTYGIGGDISWKDWQQYMVQLINLGFCEIAFHQNNELKLTQFAENVLFEGETVELTKPVDVKEVAVKATKASAPSTVKDEELYEQLRQLRLHIAKKQRIPAYHVFSDASLRGIENLQPTTKEEFLTVSGVGQHKLKKYGVHFIKLIVDYKKGIRYVSA
jgi:ATP-dependent DNA helicase RecQ